MKKVFLLALLFSASAFSLSPRFEGEMVKQKEVWLSPFKQYVVPDCRRWLLQDIHKLNKSNIISVNGITELTSSPRHNSESHIFEGEFKYSTKKGQTSLIAIIHPGSVLEFKGANGLGIVEYSWYQKVGSCKE